MPRRKILLSLLTLALLKVLLFGVPLWVYPELMFSSKATFYTLDPHGVIPGQPVSADGRERLGDYPVVAQCTITLLDRCSLLGQLSDPVIIGAACFDPRHGSEFAMGWPGPRTEGDLAAKNVL